MHSLVDQSKSKCTKSRQLSMPFTNGASTKCLNFLHLSSNLLFFFHFWLGLSQGLAGKEIQAAETDSKKISVEFKAEEFFREVKPRQNWFKALFRPDEKQTLAKIRTTLDSWHKVEQKGLQWNLEKTGLYTVPSLKEKKKFISKNFLKYIDNRFSEEMKKSKKGTVLRKVETVRETLRPNTKISINKNVKIKFKAKVLAGSAEIIVDNPYIDWNARVNVRGHVSVHMGKYLESLGLKTELNYTNQENLWDASIDKQLFDSINTRLSSTQRIDSMAFSGESDQKLEMLYLKTF